MSNSWINLYQDFFGNKLKCYTNGIPNDNYEEISRRRYNYSPSDDHKRIRLVFPKDILKQHPDYHTLVRSGRAIWCWGFKYESNLVYPIKV